MNKVSYLIDNPYILITQIKLEEIIRQRMIACVLAQKDHANYHGGYTFEIDDPYHDFAELYNQYLKIAETIIGPFKPSVKQKHWCWANVYNGDKNNTNMHDHRPTSTINAVFYLNVPDDMQESEGALEIYNDGKIDKFFPENCDLIIMPSWMPHRPTDHSSSQYRIAINMEISTIEKVDELYTLEKIFARCSHA